MAKISVVVVGIGLIIWFASTSGVIVPGNGVSAVEAPARPAGGSDQGPADGIEKVTLSVDGMTCRSCVPGIRRALLDIPGVKNAQVSYSAAQAVVECEKGKVTDSQLVKAIENESSFFLTFTAKVTSRK